jgi:UDP-glucuronate 4-epimerase
MKVLVTGGAGFIGSHLVDRLLLADCQVTVVDNFDPFYDCRLKEKNIEGHVQNDHYQLVKVDIRDYPELNRRLSGDYDVIVHLAAKAGVRPSIQDPRIYQEVNVGGTQNLLELAKKWGTKQFILASSSSVYGINPNVPWREEDHVLLPISPYAGTKVSCELMSHVYSHLYGIRVMVLRFFTVYGPRQRPDLAIHKFARLMIEQKPIPVYGDSAKTRRDYTFIDDIVQGIQAAMDYTASSYEVINLGNNQTVTLQELIRSLEEVLGVSARIESFPEQPGDVPQTWADLAKARQLLGYQPETGLVEGLKKFGQWFHETY